MSNTKAINNSTNTNTLYKLQDNATTFVSNAFPLRRFVKSNLDHEQAWIAAYKTETKKYFEAVLTNQKLNELERIELEKEKVAVPKRRILKHNFPENKANRQLNYLDGFYLMQLCCVDDPLDLCSIDISAKSLKNIKEEDMGLFENITEINANENNLNFEQFRSFENLRNLLLACNNIKTIRLAHEEFISLESLDLSYNSLNPNDVAHLGVLNNLKILKLTGNNLKYLPDAFTKLYVKSTENEKVVMEKFPALEELHLDHNKLKEENSFDVLAVLKKLRVLYLNSNLLTSVPNLKIFRDNHVVQEFNKSYHNRKAKKAPANSIKSSINRKSTNSIDKTTSNESIVKDLAVEQRVESRMHSSNILRNSFIIEEDEEKAEELVDDAAEEEDITNTNTNTNSNTNDRISGTTLTTTELSRSRGQSPAKKILSEINTNMGASPTAITGDMLDKAFELPFSELVYINLADNQIEEEDDLISLVSWPMLNEIIIYGNPIVYNNVGHPPLLKQYLIDRLGINLQRQRPLKALKTPLLLPQRDHRIIETSVPKIPKMPIEMRMLTYHDSIEDSSSSGHARLLSSNNTSSNFAESLSNTDRQSNPRRQSYPSSGSSSSASSNERNRANENNVYKPFKMERAYTNAKDCNHHRADVYEESYDNEYDETEDYYDSQANQNTNKNYNSFFMTQVDQEDTSNQHTATHHSDQKLKLKKKQQNQKQNRQTDSAPSSASERYKNYEMLLHIENEHEIKVPKDVGGSVRVLKQMLSNPLVYREPCFELDKKQNPYKTLIKTAPKPVPRTKQTHPRVQQVNEVLDEMKERTHVTEMNLNDALASSDKATKECSKRLFDQTQSHYEKIKQHSLKNFQDKPGNDMVQMDIIMEQIKAENA